MNRLKIYRSGIEYDVDTLKKLVAFTQKALDQECEKVGKLIDKRSKNLSTEQAQEDIVWRLEEYARMDEDFRRTLTCSYIMIVYSFLEDNLGRICNLAKGQYTKIALSYKDIKADGNLRQVSEYLKKVISYDVEAKLKEECDEIITFNKVRNRIVHDNGCIPKNLLAEIRDRIKITNDKIGKTDSIQIVAIGRGNRIEINQEYCLFITEQVKEFLLLVVDGILASKNEEILD